MPVNQEYLDKLIVELDRIAKLRGCSLTPHSIGVILRVVEVLKEVRRYG